MEEWQDPKIIALWIAIALVVVISLILYIILFTRLYFKRIIKEQEKLTKAKIDYQKQMLYDSILIQEQERNRTAANLHDGLISKLNIIKLSLFSGKSVDEIGNMLEDTCTLARGITHDLCPPLVEELSIEELIDDLLLPLSNSLNVQFHRQSIGNEPLASEHKIQILRIAQEVINNSLKYAQSESLTVYMHTSKKYLSLKIEDTGIGFDTTKQHKGLGLKNIELRVQVLGAHYKIKSKPNKGTQFMMCINRTKQNI
jgi:signal transduction histidine kinase